MLTHTHNLPAENGDAAEQLSQCRCGRCDNIWWVRCAPEFQPSYCPYCGLKFVWYDGPDDNQYRMSGQRIEDAP